MNFKKREWLTIVSVLLFTIVANLEAQQKYPEYFREVEKFRLNRAKQNKWKSSATLSNYPLGQKFGIYNISEIVDTMDTDTVKTKSKDKKLIDWFINKINLMLSHLGPLSGPGPFWRYGIVFYVFEAGDFSWNFVATHTFSSVNNLKYDPLQFSKNPTVIINSIKTEIKLNKILGFNSGFILAYDFFNSEPEAFKKMEVFTGGFLFSYNLGYLLNLDMLDFKGMGYFYKFTPEDFGAIPDRDDLDDKYELVLEFGLELRVGYLF